MCLSLTLARIQNDDGGAHLAHTLRVNSVNETIIVALAFLVLLALEWRLRFRSVRAGTIVVALILLEFSQPSNRRAARSAVELPKSERVLQISGAPPVSDYVSGVLTMERAANEDAEAGAGSRLVCMVVLTWLACTPLFRKARVTE